MELAPIEEPRVTVDLPFAETTPVAMLTDREAESADALPPTVTDPAPMLMTAVACAPAEAPPVVKEAGPISICEAAVTEEVSDWYAPCPISTVVVMLAAV